MALVTGSSNGMLAKHWLEFTIGEGAVDLKAWSVSSAGRSMVQRHGVGCVRYLDASMLWIQKKIQKRVLSVTPIPSKINPPEIGTKTFSNEIVGTFLPCEDGGWKGFSLGRRAGLCL